MSFILLLGSAFEWFATTKIGRIVGVVGVVVLLLVIAFFKVKAMGRAEEREKNKLETDKFIKDKEKIDADVADDSDAALADRVRPWVSKGK